MGIPFCLGQLPLLNKHRATNIYMFTINALRQHSALVWKGPVTTCDWKAQLLQLRCLCNVMFIDEYIPVSVHFMNYNETEDLHLN